MACLEMYNNSDHKTQSSSSSSTSSPCPPTMSPRISFSNDFADAMIKQERSTRTTTTSDPVFSDFEFSVSNYSMMSADELFFKGRLLPFKDKGQRTIRDELLANDDDEEENNVSFRPPKGSTRWKGLLGLKRSYNIGSKKLVDNNYSFDTSSASSASSAGHESRRPSFVFQHQDHVPNFTKSTTSQELSSGGDRDGEMGIEKINIC